jgi:pyridine nucleotide-disulfide oxidoreductase
VNAHPVLVIGAGPAGLATSAELTRAGIPHRVLERGDAVGHTWAHLYDSLVLHTAKRFSALPGMPFPASTPRFPTRRNLLDYLARYADTFRLPIETRADVSSATRNGDGWIVRTADGAEWHARALVVATGVVANPYEPMIPQRDRFHGRVLHSVNYRRPDSFVGERVLVVGAGNSAGEISVELARAGARVTLAVRSGATVVPLEFAGIPIQYFGLAVSWLPAQAQRIAAATMGRVATLRRGRPVLPPPPRNVCPRIPLIGLQLADALRAGTIALKNGIAQFTETGVRFDDDSASPFDAVILATGFRAAVGMLGSLIQVDRCGFAKRHDRVVSDEQRDLYFVGHNYGIEGAIHNIGRDARIVARHLSADAPFNSSARFTPLVSSAPAAQPSADASAAADRRSQPAARDRDRDARSSTSRDR